MRNDYLWKHLKAKQFLGPKFRSQEQVGSYIVDFVCYEICLIVEADGGQHHENKKYDDARTLWLNSQGFRVLRFWNNEVLANIEGVFETLLAACRNVPPLPDPLPPGESE